MMRGKGMCVHEHASKPVDSSKFGNPQNAVVESTSMVGTIDAMNLRKTTR